MKFNKLGNTDIEVSAICLGTMTYGEQNSESEAHEQLSFALESGINFIDTAELYPVPGRKETQGLTEKYIGTWLQKNNTRQDIVLATKATGPSDNLKYISDNLGFSKKRLLEAFELSLSRLQTDYIDLYQIHWPERKTNYFGVRGYSNHDERWVDNFHEAYETLESLKKEGKIRAYGISNETPWGLHRNIELADQNEWSRAVSIQNCYNLLNRLFEVGLSEMAIREKCGLLAYSPMAFGLLSGKYHKNQDNQNDRLNQFKQMSRYNSSQCYEATKRYLEIAEEYGISLAQMSLAFVNSRPFVTSNIIGATSIPQLKENIESININLSLEILKKINKVQNEIPNPAP